MIKEEPMEAQSADCKDVEETKVEPPVKSGSPFKSEAVVKSRKSSTDRFVRSRSLSNYDIYLVLVVWKKRFLTNNFRTVLDVPKLSLHERRDVKRVKPIRPIPTYNFDFGAGLSSPISPTFGKYLLFSSFVRFKYQQRQPFSIILAILR